MPRRPDPAAKIARLKEQLAALEAVAAEQAAAERKEEAKRQDARKFLVGAFVLARMPLAVWQHAAPEWWAALDEWAIRPRDRALLGLLPRASDRVVQPAPADPVGPVTMATLLAGD